MTWLPGRRAVMCCSRDDRAGPDDPDEPRGRGISRGAPALAPTEPGVGVLDHVLEIVRTAAPGSAPREAEPTAGTTRGLAPVPVLASAGRRRAAPSRRRRARRATECAAEDVFQNRAAGAA